MLAEALVEPRAGRGRAVEVLDRFPGAALDGVRYEPPFPFLPAPVRRARRTPSCWATSSPPTTAPGWSTPRSPSARTTSASGSATAWPSSTRSAPTAPTTSASGPTPGASSRTPTPTSSPTSSAAGGCCAPRSYEHSYPYCWRCGDPLLYYAKPSWYIATSHLRDRLLAANETVDWHPEHIKHGRFGDWLENNVDWALSRERYWGTPLPVWRCERDPGHIARRRLLRRARGALRRPARGPAPALRRRGRLPLPAVHTGGCGASPRSSTSGSTPAPCPSRRSTRRSSTRTASRARFPADFICEALDQTRGWFYSLLAISVLLFDRAPYEHVVCLGLILDGEGQKMSKSKGNIVVPWEVLDRFGADAFRWYFFTSKQPWDGYRFSTEAVGEGVRLFLRQLWNTYAFLTHLRARAEGEETDLDRWILLAAGRDAPRSPSASRPSTPRWPAARSRPSSTTCPTGTSGARGGGSGRATARLRDAARCLLTVAQLLAPFTPFIADEIYESARRRRAARCTCRDWPGPAHARPRARGGDGHGARDGAPRAGRARAGEGQGPPAAARGRGRRGGRERAAIERLADSSATSSTSARCGSSTRPTSSAPTRSSRTTGRWGRASARRCRRSPSRGGARPRARRRAAARRRAGRRHVEGHEHGSAPRTCCSCCSRWTATSSSARARTRSPSSSRSTRSCAARASRARSSTRSRARARRRPGRRGPHRAGARRRRRAAGRRTRARGLRGRRDARDRGRRRPAPATADAATIEGRELRIAVERA